MEQAFDDLSDDDLIRRVQDQEDEAAFAELVYRHQGRVRASLRRYVQQDDLIDDLAQDVFIAVFRYIDRYQFGTSFPFWILGIARNKVLHHLRHERVRRKHHQGGLLAITAQWDTDEQLVRSEAEESSGLIYQALDECLAHLQKRSRKLLQDHYFDGKTSGEIAEELGKTDSAVRMSLLRIRKTLSKCMHDKLPEGVLA